MKRIANLFLVLTLLLGGVSLASCEKLPEIEGTEQGGTENNIPTTPVAKSAVLSASTSIIVADGEDEVTFTVLFGEQDVTDSVYMYVDNKRMTSTKFSTDKAGSYKFFASYKGKISNTVVITAANPALYIGLPEDSQPDKFDGFDRKVLVAEGTGTWCGYCPYMIRALELFEENGSNASKAVIVATHSGDEFSNQASEAAVVAMKIKGFPSCVLNLDPEILIENNNPDINAEYINTMVGMELKEAARVGIAATTAVSADSTVVGVRTAVKVGEEGSYRINAWLIEDGVEAYQNGAEVIDHKHILRAASHVSPIQGVLLGEKETCSAGEQVEFYYEFDTKKADVESVENCKVVVLVTATNGTSSKYVVNNIIECPVGESVPFAYK